jgi:hypothetical protein
MTENPLDFWRMNSARFQLLTNAARLLYWSNTLHYSYFTEVMHYITVTLLK